MENLRLSVFHTDAIRQIERYGFHGYSLAGREGAGTRGYPAMPAFMERRFVWAAIPLMTLVVFTQLFIWPRFCSTAASTASLVGGQHMVQPAGQGNGQDNLPILRLLVIVTQEFCSPTPEGRVSRRVRQSRSHRVDRRVGDLAATPRRFGFADVEGCAFSVSGRCLGDGSDKLTSGLLDPLPFRIGRRTGETHMPSVLG